MHSILLSRESITAYQKIQISVRSRSINVHDLLQLCLDTEIQDLSEGFPIFYAAVLLSAQRDRDAALDILAQCAGKPLCDLLAEHLAQGGNLTNSATQSGEAAAFDIWARSAFAVRQRELITKAAIRSLLTSPSQKPIIVDLGTGNGQLITQLVNTLALCNNIKRVELVLVDRSRSALELAAEHCEKYCEVPACIEIIETDLAHFDWSSYNFFTNRKVWFANAAACIHHFPRRQKIGIIRKLAGLASTLLLSEIEGNHDSPESQSPELVYSVWQFYGSLVTDLLASDFSDREKQICLRSLLLDEAFGILGQDYPHRSNYHMLIDEWLEVSRSVGMRIGLVSNDEIQEGAPRGLTIALHSRH